MLRAEVDCIMPYLSILDIVPLEIRVWCVVYVPRLIGILVRRVSMSKAVGGCFAVQWGGRSAHPG